MAANDSWGDTQRQDVANTGIAPTHFREAAIVQTLDAGAYTAVIRGVGETTGVGLVEVYDLDGSNQSRLANISTRGFVKIGDSVMIAGFIIVGPDPAQIVVRGIGPSLTNAGVEGALADTSLELHDVTGALVASNDDWQQDPAAAAIAALQIAPTDARESATLQTLPPGAYTAIIRGKGDATGVGLVEVYHIK